MKSILWLMLGFIASSCTTNRLLESERTARMHTTILSDVDEESTNTYAEMHSDAEPTDLDPKLHRIRPGDDVTILIHGQEGFDTMATVSSSGTIVMPLVGSLSVAGLTSDELEGRIRRELASYLREDVVITLSVRNTRDEMVSVLGSVRNPSNYPVIGDASLFEVLSMAGGTLEDADLGSIRIYRSHSPVTRTVVDVNRTLEQGDFKSEPLTILPGDIIMVPRKDNLVRELSFFLRDVVLLFGLFNTFR